MARIKAELAMSPFRGRLGEWMGEDLRMFRLNMLAEKMIYVLRGGVMPCYVFRDMIAT